MCFKPEYVIILAASTVIDYFLGLRIAVHHSKTGKKRLLILGLIHNIGLLAALKYLDFFGEAIDTLLKPFNILSGLKGIELIVPIGISYYTFKKISYLIDVYRGNLEPEKRLSLFALYVSFFPEIMAGPIDRAGALIPQFRREHVFAYERVTGGLKLMAWGFFKKLVIADRLAAFVDKAYGNPTQYEGVSLVAATVYFSFQIYCDFSGYTDIARGAGKILGFDLAENFNRPYFSRSIGDFWKRWHISLSNWLRDYLFLPIAFNISRNVRGAKLLNIKAETWSYMTGIIVTMLLCGLWHSTGGTGWTFITWGLCHGIFLAVSFATKRTRKKIRQALGIKKNSFIRKSYQVVFTFSMVTLAWIFFRANSMSDALYIVTHLFSGWSKALVFPGFLGNVLFGIPKKELAVALVSLGFMFLIQLLRKDHAFEQMIAKQKPVVRWSFYLVFILWLMAFGGSGTENFIYFRF